MTRYANLKRDAEIASLVFDHGKAPKEVVVILHLPNVWIVYRVLRKLHVETKRQNSPITNLEVERSNDLNS